MSWVARNVFLTRNTSRRDDLETKLSTRATKTLTLELNSKISNAKSRALRCSVLTCGVKSPDSRRRMKLAAVSQPTSKTNSRVSTLKTSELSVALRTPRSCLMRAAVTSEPNIWRLRTLRENLRALEPKMQEFQEKMPLLPETMKELQEKTTTWEKKLISKRAGTQM